MGPGPAARPGPRRDLSIHLPQETQTVTTLRMACGLLLGLLLLLPPASRAQQDELRFDVWEFQVSGNTVLDAREIEKTVYPFLGPQRTVSDVEQARQALEALYRDAGYGTVVINIPEQDVEEGMVRLDVLEGAVDRLVVTGAEWFSPARIRQAVPSLAEGSVPLLPEVQQELAALNAASADRSVAPVLRPGRFPGTVEVELNVDDQLPLHGFVELNDRYTRDTTRTRLSAGLSYDNLWQRQHSASIGYQTAPEETEEVKVLYGTYTARLPGGRWLVSGYAVTSDSAVSTVGTLGVIGKGQIYGARFIRPLPMLGSAFQRATLGIDYKDFDENIALEGNQPTIETPIAYGVLSAGWTITFPGEGRVTEFSVNGVYGPRFLGNDTTEFANKHFGARASFAHAGLTLSHEQDSWQATRLRMLLGAQLADSPMISNEQFAVGGVASVRGYLESQQFVDDGYWAQLEWLSPDWLAGLPLFDTGQLYAFMDAGGGRIREPLPEQDDNFFLWSTGLGLRTELLLGFSAALEYAWPLRDSADLSVEAGDPRFHFNLRWAF